MRFKRMQDLTLIEINILKSHLIKTRGPSYCKESQESFSFFTSMVVKKNKYGASHHD
jgi:hypothetical protein